MLASSRTDAARRRSPARPGCVRRPRLGRRWPAPACPGRRRRRRLRPHASPADPRRSRRGYAAAPSRSVWPARRCRPRAPASRGRARSTAGTGTGSSPCARGRRPAPTRHRARGDRDDAEVRPARRRRRPRRRSESSAPTSWKCTSSGGDAVHLRLGVGQPGEDCRRVRAYRPGQGRAIEQVADVAPGPVRRVGVRGVHLDLEGPQPGPRDRTRRDPYGAAEHRRRRRRRTAAMSAPASSSAPSSMSPGDAGRRVDPGVPVPVIAGTGAAIWAARCPAPYPLSMLTTATPGAQAFSIASSAAKPSKAAP